MKATLKRPMAIVSILTLFALAPATAAAQTASQLGAWDALMTTPVGALSPVAHNPGDPSPGINDLAIRYGRWHYDADDAVHDNIGMTWTHGLGFAKAQLAVTGGYELVECPTCSGWVMGGIDLQSNVWNYAVADAHVRPRAIGIALRVSVGGAHYLGSDGTTTTSAAVTVPLDFSWRLRTNSSLTASLLPGLGFGHIMDPDLTESGALPMIGGALAWQITSRLAVNAGLQRVIILGGPTQVGAALSLKLGAVRERKP